LDEKALEAAKDKFLNDFCTKVADVLVSKD
jgi:hypothetical protein